MKHSFLDPASAILPTTIAAMLCGLFAMAPSVATSQSNAMEADLLARLRAGGHVIVIRHAATDRSRSDHDLVDFGDCSTQRNLSLQGRADALTIGVATRHLEIPVGAVWASPYCRAVETAERAFGRATVVEGLERLYPVRDETADSRVSQLILDQMPLPGEPNLFIVSHGVYPAILQPDVAIGEGEAAIYAMSDGENTELVGRVAPDAWLDLDPQAAVVDDAADLSEVSERVLRSVVSVEIADGRGARTIAGSGFRIAVPRMVVTSAAIIGSAENVSVVLADGTRREAHVVSQAQDSDIAVLELDDTGLPPLHSGSGLAELRDDDLVVAVGAMLGLPGTAVPGTVRVLGRGAHLQDGAVFDILEVDASLGPGYAGGPLINADGLVVGVITMIAAPTNTGQAIPVDIAKREAQSIIAGR